MLYLYLSYFLEGKLAVVERLMVFDETKRNEMKRNETIGNRRNKTKRNEYCNL